jgi:flagellar hook-associated protein 1 FlgK
MNSLNIGLSGLKAAQIAMDVTSHNIANVNTPNFARQVVDFSEVSFPSGSKSIPSGAGVAVANIRNVTDTILNNNYSDALSNSNEYDTLNSLAKPFDALVNSPSLNLSTAMQDTFNSFQDVANTPTSIPIRQNAINQAQTLVDKSKNLMTQLSGLKNGLQDSLSQNITDVNNLTQQIGELNKQIQFTGGNQSSALAGQRDALTLDLAKLTGINVSQDKSTITTTSGKVLIQNGSKVTPLTDKDIPSITGGSIGGTNKFINNMLTPAMNQLPGVIQNAATKINEQAVKGFDLNGNPGTPIFNVTNGSLDNFSVNITDPKTLGASTDALGTGDGTNAQKISDLKTQLYNGQTFQSQYSSTLSNFDNKVKSYSDMSAAYDASTSDFANQLHNLSGVNLDEEAVNLLKYKQMYQANAQVIKTQNEMFATLINITA